MPDIETREGREQVYKDIVMGLYSGDSRSDSVIRALDNLGKLYGDAQAIEDERRKIPVESIISHLIKSELNGVNPVDCTLDELAARVMSALDLESCSITRAGNTGESHKTKHKKIGASTQQSMDTGVNSDAPMHTVGIGTDGVTGNELIDDDCSINEHVVDGVENPAQAPAPPPAQTFNDIGVTAPVSSLSSVVPFGSGKKIDSDLSAEYEKWRNM